MIGKSGSTLSSGLSTAGGLIELTRPRTSICAAVLVLTGWAISDASRSSLQPVGLASLALAAFLVISFCQVYNDLIDHALDSVAKPQRPLPSGRVSPRAAKILAGTLAALAVLISLQNTAVAIWAIAALLLGVAYSLRMKSTLISGAVVVAVVSSSPLALAAIAERMPPSKRLIVAVLLVTLYIVGNELYKSAEDEVVDRQFGVRNLATQRGGDATLAALTVVALALLLVIISAAVSDVVSALFLAWSVVGIASPTVASVVVYRKSLRTADAPSVGPRLWRLAWLPGMIAMLLLIP